MRRTSAPIVVMKEVGQGESPLDLLSDMEKMVGITSGEKEMNRIDSIGMKIAAEDINFIEASRLNSELDSILDSLVELRNGRSDRDMQRYWSFVISNLQKTISSLEEAMHQERRSHMMQRMREE